MAHPSQFRWYLGYLTNSTLESTTKMWDFCFVVVVSSSDTKSHHPSHALTREINFRCWKCFHFSHSSFLDSKPFLPSASISTSLAHIQLRMLAWAHEHKKWKVINHHHQTEMSAALILDIRKKKMREESRTLSLTQFFHHSVHHRQQPTTFRRVFVAHGKRNNDSAFTANYPDLIFVHFFLASFLLAIVWRLVADSVHASPSGVSNCNMITAAWSRTHI